MKRIKITMGDVSLSCTLRDCATADAVLAALPIESTAQTWGDEVYFSTPVSVAPEDDAREVVELGEIAFWPPGNAIAIAFGPTPVSSPGEIRLASGVNVFADCEIDPEKMRTVLPGSVIRVEQLP